MVWASRPCHDVVGQVGADDAQGSLRQGLAGVLLEQLEGALEIVEQLKAVVSMQPQRLVLGQLGRHGIQPQQLLGRPWLPTYRAGRPGRIYPY